MDIAMPDMDGISAIKQLRADLRSAGIRVAALTTYTIRGQREGLLAQGFDDYLAKETPIYSYIVTTAEGVVR